MSFWHDIWTPFGPLSKMVTGLMSYSENEVKVERIINQGNWDLQNITLTPPPHIMNWILNYPRKVIDQGCEDTLACWVAKGNYFDSKLVLKNEWERTTHHCGREWD